MMKFDRILSSFAILFGAFAILRADTQVTEYKTNIGGNWFSPTTWNVLPSANVSYPNSFSDAFCMEGSDTVVVLDSDATVGRMIGGGGAFSGNKVVGSGKLTFDSHYDSTNSYDYSASALWGNGDITYENTGGVHYTTSDDKSSGWSDTVGVKIFFAKNTNTHSQTYNTSVSADVVTSMNGTSAEKSVINFNSSTSLTDFYVTNGTVNFNGSSSFGTVTANATGVVNVSGSVLSGSFAGTGTINFTGDYTKADGASANIGTIITKSSAAVNFNHAGQIATGYQYYENNGKVLVSENAIVKISENAAAGDSWGSKFLVQIGGSSFYTLNGTLDATNYNGDSNAQIIRNWGNFIINQTGVLKGSGNTSSFLYMGRESNFTVNGDAKIEGVSYIYLNQTVKTSSTVYINDSNTLADIYLVANKDKSNNDGTTDDTLTNTNVFLSGDVAIKSLNFYQKNNQFTIDLRDCTSLVLETLFTDSNANANGGKIIFTNFKNGIVYIENTSGLDIDNFSDYVLAEGWELSIEDGYIVGSQIPEPCVFAFILSFAGLLLALRNRNNGMLS